jgi:hypothetical protein
MNDRPGGPIMHVNVQPRVLSATTIIGDRVRNEKGEDLGKIEELMIDCRVAAFRTSSSCDDTWLNEITNYWGYSRQSYGGGSGNVESS